MEDTKCEDTEFNNMIPLYSQVNQTCSDTKSFIDSKNTQVRVVRGAKKFKIDNDISSIEKKGMLAHNLYVYNKYFNC